MTREEMKLSSPVIVARLSDKFGGGRLALLFKTDKPYEHYEEDGEEVPYDAIESWQEVNLSELAESEDERIPRLLHKLLCAEVTAGQFEKHGLTVDDALYWLEHCLEKQKEQKPNQSEEEREYVKTLKVLVSDFIRDSGGISDVAYYQRIYDWLDGRHIEQKPVEQNSASGNSENSNNHAEWSEEDEHCIELLDTIIESSALIPKNRRKCHKFLQSLRPQSHWKPTGEQMEALRIAYEIGTANESWAMGVLKHFIVTSKTFRI